MNNFSHKKIRGASLIDALIAMAVGGIGLLALAVFQANMLNDSSGSRARTEALNLAQQKIEQLRDLAVRSDFIKTAAGNYVAGDRLFNQSATATGINATFTVASVISGLTVGTSAASTDAQYVTAKVTVSWTDNANSQESVMLASLVAWDNPISAAARGDVSSIDQLITVGAVPAPSAGGRLAEVGEALLANSYGDNQDGTQIYYGDGEYQIAAIPVNGTLQPVFVSTEPLMKLSGNISTDGSAPLTILRVLTSDFGFCIYNENGVAFSGSNGVQYSVVDSTGIPNSGDFNCYVAASWHGNLGVLNKTGENFCSAAHRYTGNCQILESPLYVDFTGTGDCPYTSGAVSGLIGELEDQNFSINNGGCALADAGVALPSVIGNISFNGRSKPASVFFSVVGGNNGPQQCTAVTGRNGVAQSYKCISSANSSIILKLIFDDATFCRTAPITVGTLEVTFDLNSSSCN